ncbi:Stk1 family PASTA domain-containing Ser/Thr kinase [Raoultibacter timonensis]|uniref:Stk1 family PASTA domain-containing Ser/Thr kinase n=1 Tax=Raoultibacter timonensis TaxID=1907662 RepID=UPI0026DCAC8E|nr:Stk1 family PASTA domain-containing Ser/Thr kinase [Raoultibacter timonensis]
MIGKVFNNRYQITERIGIGGMAEVYRAQDNVLGRLVAVKTMLPQYAADPSFTQRFKQEAAAAANLQSPYIVNVYDWGHDDDTYYIVMEYVRGSDLKTAINERGAINQRKVAEIGSQVCQALSVAHKLDIIHRDIKPQNIMVQPDGNVKVMDFGIARAKNSVKTQTSSVLGTAHYISPEQAQGKELTAASDIYSLGIVLYEASTGRLPFDGPDAVSVAMKQVNDLPVAPHEINPDIDPTLEAIIMKALAKNPLERFATANDMKQALNDYLAGRPVMLGGGFGSAETAVIGAAAGVGMGAGAAMADGTAVMPVAGNGGVKPVNTPSNYRASDSSKPKNNKKTIGIVVAVVAALVVIGVAVFAFSGMFASGDPIPDVKNKSVEEATQIIEDAGFKIGKTTEVFDDDIAAGNVTGTDPKAGEKREKGSTVNLLVSKGAEEITVPDLTGKSADDAKKELTAAGLNYKAGTAEYSETVDKDLVARQDPAAGTKVKKGDTITYYVSLGSDGTEVPNVIGDSEGSATTTLENKGFKVTTEYQYSDEASGTVIGQTPNAGEKLKEGDTVHLVISQGKKTATYSVSVNSNGGGKVSASSSSVDEGGSVTITITPDSGYEVASVKGLDGVGANGGTFTITVTSNVTINVTFQATTPTPTPPDPSGDDSNNTQTGTGA